MLENPQVARVAGDAESGFYRRRWVGGPPDPALPYADRPGRRREAYSWGGLTSGAASRTMWLLLLPFMLANVAFWMYPAAAPPGRPRWWAPARDLSAALQRLFALSLTVAFTLSLVVAFTDGLGWQCGNDPGCVAGHGILRFPVARTSPAGLLSLASLAALAGVVLLWLLGAKTWNSYEQLGVVAAAEEGDPFGTPLGARKMWNGSEPVRRLRAVHVTTGFATAAAFPLAASDGVAPRAALGAVLALAAYGLVALARPAPFRRPAEPAPVAGPRRDQWYWLPRVTGGLVAFGLAALPVAGVPAGTPTGPLPGLGPAVRWLVGGQVVLLGLVLVVTAAVALGTRPERPEGPALPGRALAGLAAPVVLVLAALVGAGLGSGLVLRVADYLGTPVAAGTAPEPAAAVAVPTPYYWSAALVFLTVAALVVTVPPAYLLSARRARAAAREQILAAYPAARTEPGRAGGITRSWAAAMLTDRAGALLGLVAVVLPLAAAAATAAWRQSWLTTAGSWTAAAMLGGLLGLARSAYRDPRIRRTVGIVWDLGTFWPRATHPLAPPCYCERAMPDLARRIDWLAPDPPADLVVLSTHSQGTVIGAALVLQLSPEQRRRVALLTYGSPLQRLYCRFFPAYFNAGVFATLGRALAAAAAAPEPEWPWRNLFRGSDPIGGPVRRPYVPGPGRDEAVDRALLDPLFDRAAGDGAYPPTYGHSDYFADPEYAASVDRVVALARARGQSARP